MSDRRVPATWQVRELKHPVRLRILELVVKDPRRSLAAADLVPELRDEFDVSASQVAYHLARLRDAEMLPLGA